jgi:hypothetical protein
MQRECARTATTKVAGKNWQINVLTISGVTMRMESARTAIFQPIIGREEQRRRGIKS